MAYTKQTWADLPSKTTPINAERLTHIEDGIFNAAQTADTAASTAGTAAANVGIVSGRVETLTGRVNDLDTAVSNKVDKVAGKGLSENDFTNTLKSKLDGIASGAEVNIQSDWNQSDNSADDYIKNKPTLGTASTKNSTSVVTQSTDLVESGAVYDALGFGNKNLLPNNGKSQTINGVTFTVNADGSVTANGTATAQTYFPIIYHNAPILLELGNYLLSGCTNGANDKYFIYLTDTNGNHFNYNDSDNYVVDNNTGNIDCTINIRNGVTLNNVTFYPMIRKATVTDSAYEPYHPSVEKYIPQVVSDAVGWDVGNLLVYPYRDTTKTTNGITFTVNDDNSITVNGTATADAYFFLVDSTVRDTVPRNVNLTLKGGNTQVKVRYYIISFGDEAGNEVDFNIPSNAAGYNLTLKVSSGVTVNNMVIYPKLYHFDVDKQKADNSVIGTVENGTNPTKSYAVGEHMVRGRKFCTVTSPVTTSSTWTLNSNYVEGDVASVLNYKADGNTVIATGSGSTVFNFPYKRLQQIHSSGLIILSGGLYHVFIASDNTVTVTKILDNNQSRDASGSYTNDTLTITFTVAVYGAVSLVCNNIVN